VEEAVPEVEEDKVNAIEDSSKKEGQ